MKQILSLMRFLLQIILILPVVTLPAINQNTIVNQLFFPLVTNQNPTVVAKWKNDSEGAFFIEFDDSWPSHVDIAVPELTKRNLVGTFLINPGNYGYQARKSSWEQIGSAGVQELANHTMTHSGASNYADADYEIGGTARIIWSLRPPGISKIQAFNRGGATVWNITKTQMQEVLAKYFAIQLTHLLYPSQDRTINNLQNLKNLVDQAIKEKSWIGTNFHCIHDVPGDKCAMTTNKSDFLSFLNYIQPKVQSGDIWNAGWAAIYMYDQERTNSLVKVINETDTRIEISLTSTLDPTLYNVPLTLITYVPSSWTYVRVTQGGNSISYSTHNGKLTYDAVPGNRNIILERQYSEKIMPTIPTPSCHDYFHPRIQLPAWLSPISRSTRQAPIVTTTP